MNTAILKDQTLLITGAAGGLGSALAGRCAAHGATVVLLDKNAKGLETVYDAIVAAGGPEPLLLPADLEGISPDDCQAIVAQLNSDFGRLNGLIHCAARFDGLTPHGHLAGDEWLRVMQANLNGPWLLTQACLPLLAESDPARCIFVLENLPRVAGPHWGAYGVSKHALMALVKQLREELEHSGVTVFGFNPGPMMTALRSQAFVRASADDAPDPEIAAERLVTILASVANPASFIDLEAD